MNTFYRDINNMRSCDGNATLHQKKRTDTYFLTAIYFNFLTYAVEVKFTRYRMRESYTAPSNMLVLFRKIEKRHDFPVQKLLIRSSKNFPLSVFAHYIKHLTCFSNLQTAISFIRLEADQYVFLGYN